LLVAQRLRRTFADCGFVTYRDIEAERIDTYLVRRMAEGITSQTRKHYVRAVRQFCKWMVDTGRAGTNPVRLLKAGPVRNNSPRAFEVDEFQRLIEATETAETVFGLSGYERALLYRFAVVTGLRRNEIACVTVGGIDFANRTVFVSGVHTKNGDDAIQPITQDLADDLKVYVRSRPPAESLFPRITDKTARMIRADCERAGVPTADERGPVTFHSLRHTCGTWLASQGVHPKVIQEIMRHKDIRLTMNRYGHVLYGQTAKAIDTLPTTRRNGHAIPKSGTMSA